MKIAKLFFQTFDISIFVWYLNFDLSMSIFSLSGINLLDAIDIFNFGAIYIMSMVYIANVLSQKKLLENSVSIYASIAFLLVGASITFAGFNGFFSFDLLHHWSLRLTMSVAIAFIIYSVIINHNEKRFEKVVNAVAVKNRDFSKEVSNLNTKFKYVANKNQLINKSNLNLLNKLQDEVLSSIRGEVNSNLSNYYQFSDKIYQLNGSISLLNEKIKIQHQLNKIFCEIANIAKQLAKLCYVLSAIKSIKKCNFSIYKILTIINYDKVELKLYSIYNLVNEKIEKQRLDNYIQNQIKQQSQKLYENIADDIKEINGTKTLNTQTTNNIFDEDLLEEEKQENKVNENKIIRDKILTNAKHNQMFPLKNNASINPSIKSNEELSIDMSRLDRSFAIITQDMYGLKQDMFILRGNVQEAVDKIAKLFDLMAVSMESRQ